MQHNHSFKKLKSSPGAQTVTHAALNCSAYVSNMTEKHQEAKYCNALHISVWFGSVDAFQRKESGYP